MNSAADRTAPRHLFSRAVQHLREGRLDEARAAIDRALDQNPENADAAHLKGVILFQAGARDAAVEQFETALKLSPGNAQALSDLGMVLHALGRYCEAEGHLTRAVTLAPDMAAAHLNLGNVFQAQGRDHRAEGHYRKSLELQPRLGAALNNLSRLLLGAGRPGESAEMAHRLIVLVPTAAAGYSKLGSAYDRLGRFEEAIAAHEEAVARSPGDSSVRLGYAASLTGYGRMADAEAQYREVIRRDPGSAVAHVQLGDVVRLSADPDLMARIEAMMQRAELSAADRGRLGLALARAREQLSDFEGAFATMSAANDLVAGETAYSVAASDDLVDDVISAFDAGALSRFEGTGVSSDTPIFIVGMPRSGTTLIEQILCSRDDVFGAGEPLIMQSLVHATCEQAGVSSFSDMMRGIEAAGIAQIGRDYDDILRQYSHEAAHIVDKLPGNFLLVGLIHLALPRAKIVHCRRNPADTCLSIFKTGFATGNLSYAYNLDHLAQYYAAYQRVMAHWHDVLPGVVHDIDYEAMVADQRWESRRLFAHCGLEWTEDALRFHETAGPVHTASVAQVRQPIYGGSRGIASRYGEAARPLFAALERAGVDPAGCARGD